METNKLIAGIVAAAIAIIVLAGVLMPALSNATTTHETFKNDEYFFTMDKLDSSAEHVISWVATKPTVITVDDVEITPTWGSVTVFCEEDNMVRCSKVSNSSDYYINLIGAVNEYGTGDSTKKSMTLTISNGSFTWVTTNSDDTTATYTSDFNVAYCINPSGTGDYVMKTPTAKSYVLGDSTIYGMGNSTINGVWQNVILVAGSVDDDITATVVSSRLDTDPVLSNVQIFADSVSGYNDLYKFEKVTMTATENSINTTLTYSYVIVPAEVTAERSVHLTDAMNVILNVIPLLIIVSVLLGVVAIFILRRE